MQLGLIALRIRQADISAFGTRVYGSGELAKALEFTLEKEAAFVIPLGEVATANDEDGSINQVVTERFGVVFALKNDNEVQEKLGLTAYDRLHALRAELFSGLLGWQIDGNESLVTFASGVFMEMDRAWFWYRYDFDMKVRLTLCDDGLDQAALEENIAIIREIHAKYANPDVDGLPNPDILDSLIAEPFEQIVKKDHAYGAGYADGFDNITQPSE